MDGVLRLQNEEDSFRLGPRIDDKSAAGPLIHLQVVYFLETLLIQLEKSHANEGE